MGSLAVWGWFFFSFRATGSRRQTSRPTFLARAAGIISAWVGCFVSSFHGGNVQLHRVFNQTHVPETTLMALQGVGLSVALVTLLTLKRPFLTVTCNVVTEVIGTTQKNRINSKNDGTDFSLIWTNTRICMLTERDVLNLKQKQEASRQLSS